MSLTDNVKVEHDLLASVVSPFTKFHRSSGRNVLKQAVNFSSYSNSGFQTTVYPPSSSTIIDKRMLLQATVSVTTTAANSLEQGAPRCFPLASVMSSLQISINGNSTTSTPRDLVYFLQRFSNDSLFRSKYWSMTPSLPDPCSSYAKCPKTQRTTIPIANIIGANVQARTAAAALVPDVFVQIPDIAIPAINQDFPVNWSPFADSQFYKGDAENSRAAFPYTVNVAGTVNTYTFCEPLLHPLCSDNEIEGLSNVRELSVQITFDTNLLRLFSKPTAIAGGAINLVVAAPKLLLSYFEAEDQSSIPLSISLPYTQHVVKNLALGALANAPTTRSFSNIILGQVPSRMYVFARPSNAALAVEIADGFACIEGVNFTIGNRSGILASASSQQLYQMSVSNGLCMSWNEYSRRVGSVMCIDVGSDIGSLQPGSLGNVSISFDVTLANRIFLDPLVDNPANVYAGNFDLYAAFELEGSYLVSQDSAQLSLGLSASDMIEAEATEPLDLSDVKKGSGMMTGGSVRGWRKFYGGLKKAVRSTNRFVQKLASGPGMDSNIYLQGAAKIMDQTNNMMSGPPKAQLPAPDVASGMYRGRGLLRM